MGHGGKRKGSGRKKGTTNKINAEARKKAFESGLTPLEYMLNIMRDKRQKQGRRDDMSKAAAPYLHPKLSSVDMKAKVKSEVKSVNKNMNVTEAAEAYESSLRNAGTDE